jgi:hypothetical protein
MPLMCWFGRHVPVRSRALLDLNDYTQETHCKRCGAPMERESGGGWRIREAG